MAKTKMCDKKRQERFVLDELLRSIVENGVIYLGSLKKRWKSIQPYLNRNRLIYFLTSNGVKMAPKAVNYIASIDKTLAKGVPPELVVA